MIYSSRPPPERASLIAPCPPLPSSIPPSPAGSAAPSLRRPRRRPQAWPQIRAGRHTLVAAPTGSGKTLTAFLAALDGLVRQGLRPEGLPDETVVVYVSPLKALSNDIRLNLEAPLAGIAAELADSGLPAVEIRTAVRTGDTPGTERQRALRKPPHILVTTPESLYVLLGSPRSRAMLATVRAVIVDEIHAVAASKRGSHLALSLERLAALVEAHARETGKPQRLCRIGLSATQKPIAEIARFLVGAAATTDGVADCAIVDIGYAKQRDLALELPLSPLSAVMSNDQWEEVYGRVAELVLLHRTTLVFVNTRRMAERASRHLGERLGKEAVAAHHGSLAKETRLDAEQRLKRGELKVLVATASLELGLDIGDVDLVCQLGSPRSIATFLQRAGRSGHAVGGVPKARLFPQTRDELVECAALLDCIRRGELDALRLIDAPLDVLAQQIVAETACREWDEDELFALVRRAWPYAGLSRERFAEVVRMVSRRLHHAPWPARRLGPSRRGASQAAREERGAARRAHLGRHDPRDRRLRGAARAAGARDRQRQRGLRGREHQGRRLPARQRQLPDPEDRAGPGAGRGRPGRGAEHPVLARRGAGADRRALLRRFAAARRSRGAARRGRAERVTPLARAASSASPPKPRPSSPTTSGAPSRRWARCRPSAASSSSASSTNRAACSW